MLQTYRSVIVTNAKQEKYEITASVAELNIVEDIESNMLSGNILYLDDNGGLNDINFTGNEKITIELYQSSGEESVTTHDFIVYKISDVERINDGTSAFMIHFMSVEAVINLNTKCVSAMSGSNSQVVKALYRYLNSAKKIDIEDTSGNYKFVMPSTTPLECINWYAGRSISSESRGSFFLFYETLKDGFQFKCIDTLADKDAKLTYRYEPAGLEPVIKDVSNIRSYEILQAINSVEGYDEHYTTLWNSDSIRKKIVKQNFSYDENKKSKLNGGDSVTSSSKENGFDINLEERRQAYGGKVIVRSEARNTHTQTQNYYYDSIQPKLSAMRQYGGLRIQFLVFGNRDLQIGQTINLSFMKTKMFDSETKENSTDETLSGKYLITAIRYKYRINSFEMSIEAVKDTKEK